MLRIIAMFLVALLHASGPQGKPNIDDNSKQLALNPFSSPESSSDSDESLLRADREVDQRTLEQPSLERCSDSSVVKLQLINMPPEIIKQILSWLDFYSMCCFVHACPLWLASIAAEHALSKKWIRTFCLYIALNFSERTQRLLKPQWPVASIDAFNDSLACRQSSTKIISAMLQHSIHSSNRLNALYRFMSDYSALGTELSALEFTNEDTACFMAHMLHLQGRYAVLRLLRKAWPFHVYCVVLDYLYQRNMQSAIRHIRPRQMIGDHLTVYLQNHMEPLLAKDYTYIALSCVNFYLEINLEAALALRRDNVAAWLSIFITEDEHNNALWRELLTEYQVNPVQAYASIPIPFVPVHCLEGLLYRQKHTAANSLCQLVRRIIKTHVNSPPWPVVQAIFTQPRMCDECLGKIVYNFGHNVALLAVFRRKNHRWLVSDKHRNVVEYLMLCGATWQGAAECAMKHKLYYTAALIEQKFTSLGVTLSWRTIDSSAEKTHVERALDDHCKLARVAPARELAIAALKHFVSNLSQKPSIFYIKESRVFHIL